MEYPWEIFFIYKIDDGLRVSSDSLTAEERQILLTPVMEGIAASSPVMAQKLQAKCIGALSEAYARETAGKNKDVALEWRQNIDSIHRNSQLVICAIVDNWYLSVGRAQERQATGCLSVVVLGFIVLFGTSLVVAAVL